LPAGREEKYRGVVYQGLETAPENWQHAQNRLADWLQTLPPQTGIIAVTDARARHVLQACELLHIPVPEKLCVIGIDNEELTRYLSRVALSSVAQGTVRWAIRRQSCCIGCWITRAAAAASADPADARR
jgi:LacI family transcriptional regulator